MSPVEHARVPEGTAGETYLVVRIPDYPPYGGAFEDVVPHLTLEERSALAPHAARNTLDAVIPVTTGVGTLELWLIHADGIEVVRQWPS